jgi:aspartate carbamoyltransferase catalytic subunit
MVRLIRSIDDLDDATVDTLLTRARQLQEGCPGRTLPDGTLIGLLFLDTSLRTRVGFTAAAARLGAAAVTVDAPRSSPRSMPESWPHTLRTLAGYVDLVVARIDEPLTAGRIPPGADVPVLNAGDVGPAAEHPSQALIDVFALQQLRGDLRQLRLALVGDLRMRAVRSLLSLLARTPPRAVRLVTVPALMDGFELPAALRGAASHCRMGELDDVDAVYVAGIPHGAVGETDRTALRITEEALRTFSSETLVLSPLPVIDEMAEDVFWDDRVRAFHQSDSGLYVRMAII